jgi:hypothetical protein
MTRERAASAEIEQLLPGRLPGLDAAVEPRGEMDRSSEEARSQ